MKLYILFFLFLFSPYTTLQAIVLSSFSLKKISKIAQHNLQTLEWEEEEWPNDFYETLIFADHIHANPQPYQKRNIAYNVLKQSATAPVDYYTVIDEIAWEDLELLCGKKNKESYLASILDRTCTQLGRVTFFSLLAQPTTDISLIEQRKNAIKELCENDELYNNLIVLFNNLKKHENSILSFWRSSDVFNTSSERLHFQHPWFVPLNNYSLALDIRNRFLQSGRYASLAASCLATVILPLYGLSKLTNIALPTSINNLGKDLKNTNKGALTNLVQKNLDHKIFNRMLSIITGIYTAFSLRGEFKWERELITLEYCMQSKLIHVASYLKNACRINEQIQKNSLLIENIPTLQNLSLVINSTNPTLRDFFELIQAPTFFQPASQFSRQGKIVRAYKLMYTIKSSLIPLFEALGNLDAFLSVASFMRENNQNNIPCSFVEFSSSLLPYIHLIDFWHPSLSGTKAVKNNITLGGEERQNIIVTGPNAGGKSTILKGIATNLILAQVFGISTAQKAIITPFTKILTYLNIVDDLGSGNSLFKAEVLRAHDIITTVKTLQNSTTPDKPQFAFVIADELFNSTTPKEGEAGGYSIARHLGSFDNCITVIATHFELLTHLEYKSATFKNYRVIIKEHADGTFNYLYKLEPGISDQHIAFKMLAHEGFSDDILRVAHDILAGKKHASI